MTTKSKVDEKVIESFLEGNDPQKYIVAVEAGYSDNKVVLCVNDKDTGKRLETHKYKPFLWLNQDAMNLLYGGSTVKRIDACKNYGVKIVELNTKNQDGIPASRLESGFKYLASSTYSYNQLINYFKDGGIDIFEEENKKMFTIFTPAEQFLIQTGKRLFKGMDDYDDVHRLQFDLETEGLIANRDAIFQIGVRDNKGLEGIFETKGNNHQEKRDSERVNIEKFFKIIDAVQPDIITGYNSEGFDWPFLFERAERLSIPITELAITLNRAVKIKRKPSRLKIGGESEQYNQTMMYGYNIIDVSHAVRRAKAINSDIQAWGLKYITKYSGIEKPNRVYVPGDKINTIWADTVNQYCFNEADGDWYMITDASPLKDEYKIVTGAFIVQRYLCDDLWETEQIDYIYNQASFLIGKLLPTTFQRSSTMGTAGQWKLLMAAWSYQNNLAIPTLEQKRDFTGGLSRLLSVGFSKRYAKLDFAALYPKIQLTHHIFPDLDISGVMEGLLTYIVDTRDKFKFLTTEEKDKLKALKKDLEENRSSYSPEKIKEIEDTMAKHKSDSSLYDKKQLPLKILANSWFGSYGAPYIFNWGETDRAEETTCRGRQYLRGMIKFFTEKYKFKPLVLDTDGCNFGLPDELDSVTYTARGDHWKTTGQGGKVLTGLDAALADYNENQLTGRMGLDVDDIGTSSINFSRKNYANNIDGKVKLVGNSVKSSTMPPYIEEFFDSGIRMLLEGKGYEFIEYYYEHANRIYNYAIPLVKMASKSNIKQTKQNYLLNCNKLNKAGKPMPRKVHMELLLNEGIEPILGETVRYINVGTAKSHGDLKTEKDKVTGKKTIKINAKLIKQEVIDRDTEVIKEISVLKKLLDVTELLDEKNKLMDKISDLENSLHTDEYNVSKYLAAFNKKIEPLLVCFDKSIRNKILIEVKKVKDKETKKSVDKLQDRSVFTKSQCVLTSGQPYKESDQDKYEDLMIMEDKEIRFWDSVDLVPNNMEPDEWATLREDYKVRKAKERADGIAMEIAMLDDIIKRFDVDELKLMMNRIILPMNIFTFARLSESSKGEVIGEIWSKKWDVKIGEYVDIFKYSKDAIARFEYYKTLPPDVLLKGESHIDAKERRYQQWLTFKTEQIILTGDTVDIIDDTILDRELIDDLMKSQTPIIETPTKIEIEDEDSGDDDDENDDDDEFKSSLENEDDFFEPERPDESIVVEEEEGDEDEWNF